MFELDENRQKILEAPGNLLIMGGPGSGKTTIALLKAKDALIRNELLPIQTVLFLSFARATISRVEESANIILSSELKTKIEITTYHSFAWNLLRCHGYLLNSRPLRLLPPHEASSKLATIEDKSAEKQRLFVEDGYVHFDLFARLCVSLLKQSQAILRLITSAYPIIILDEFQDTDTFEWELIMELGKYSRLIALADPEQRIYEFRGADPARIGQYISHFNPTIFDFGSENNRSNGTDITKFGNYLLTGKNRGILYNDVLCYKYNRIKNDAHLIYLKCYILNVCERLNNSLGNEWSIAVLLPTNSLMVTVSEFLDKRQDFKSGRCLPRVAHTVAIETVGPCIAATIIAGVLDCASRSKVDTKVLSNDLREYILGRRGTNKHPTKAEIGLSVNLMHYVESGSLKGATIKTIIEELDQLKERYNTFVFTGDVAADWDLVCRSFESASNKYIKMIGDDIKYLKLLYKGSSLNAGLSQLWLRNHNYLGAKEVVNNALTQEHFSTTTRLWKGINVMTIHKAKGKEFDEVIIFEGAFPGARIVFSSDKLDQARINLRVAVTRAKLKATIITPQMNPCCLL